MPSLLLALAAATALAGCNKNDHNVVGGPESDDTANIAAEANIALPPTIVETKTYRCGDNTVIQVDWLSDNKSANLRVGEDSPVTQVVAPEPGKPLAGSGYSLTGSASAASVTFEQPGHASQHCRA